MSHREVNLRSTPHPGVRPSLVARLPAFYRERQELILPLAEAAEDLLESHESSLAQLAERWAEEAWGWTVTGCKTWAGTARALRDRLAARHEQRPRVASGLEAVRVGAGGLELRPARGRTALVAWQRSSPPARLESLEVPAELVPPGVTVQIVVASLPAEAWPRSGERIAGEIVWEGMPGGVLP